MTRHLTSLGNRLRRALAAFNSTEPLFGKKAMLSAYRMGVARGGDIVKTAMGMAPTGAKVSDMEPIITAAVDEEIASAHFVTEVPAE